MSRTQKMGRPSSIDAKCVRKLAWAFRNDYDVSEACEYAEVSRDTYYRRINKDEDFSDKMLEAQTYNISIAQVVVMRQIRAGDGNLALKLLERRCPERYSLRYIMKHGVQDQRPSE